MKIIIFIAFNLFSQLAHTSCVESTKNLEMVPEVNYIRENVVVGANHPNIDTVTLRVPSVVGGLLLKKIVISDGGILDIPKYKIPIAFEIAEGFAKAIVEIDLERIGDLNILYSYSSGECGKAFFYLING